MKVAISGEMVNPQMIEMIMKTVDIDISEIHLKLDDSNLTQTIYAWADLNNLDVKFHRLDTHRNGSSAEYQRTLQMAHEADALIYFGIDVQLSNFVQEMKNRKKPVFCSMGEV